MNPWFLLALVAAGFAVVLVGALFVRRAKRSWRIPDHIAPPLPGIFPSDDELRKERARAERALKDLPKPEGQPTGRDVRNLEKWIDDQ